MYFTLTALINANRIVAISDILAHYRIGHIDTLSYSREDNWRCIFTVLSALQEEASKNNNLEKSFFNLAAENILYLLDSINNYAIFHLCVNEVRDLWMKKLMKNYNDPEYFYDQITFDRFHAIKTMDTDNYILYEKKRNQNEVFELTKSVKMKIKRIKTLENELNSKEQYINEIGSLKRHIKHFIREKLKLRN